MSIDDLSLVTQAICSMFESRISELFGGPVLATPISPQDITPGANLVSVYLFHVMEEAHFKNQPPRGGTGPIPISHVPLGLSLYYVVTAHSPDADNAIMAAFTEQKLLGLAAKAIHDIPTLPVGTEDRIEIILRPVGLEEAMGFWSADDTRLARVSLFLEARVALIDPDPPTILPGIVLSIGTYVVPNLGPQLTGSSNTLTFLLPDGRAPDTKADPARVALFEVGVTPYDDGSPPPADVIAKLNHNNLLRVAGVALSGQPRFAEFERGPFRARLAIDTPPPTNTAWAAVATESFIELRVWTQLEDAQSGAMVALIPGVYTLRMILAAPPVDRVSNKVAFAVIPQCKVLTFVSGSEYTLRIVGSYLTDPDVEIELAAGTEVLRKDTDALLEPGEYRVDGDDTVRFVRTPTPGELIDSAHPLPVTLRINGVNATPIWISEAGA